MANKYKVELQITFTGEIEADSQEEAEELADRGWGPNAGNDLSYDGYDSLDITDLGEICEECEEVESKCDCEGEGEA